MLFFLFLLALVNGSKTLQPDTDGYKNKTILPDPDVVMVVGSSVDHDSILDRFVANPKEFAAEIQNLDPAALRNIIGLLEDLLATSEARVATLNSAVSDADSALQDAANFVAGAEDVLTEKTRGVSDAGASLTATKKAAEASIVAANTSWEAAKREESQAQDALDKARTDHSNQVQAKNEAESNLNGEVGGLNNEQEVIRKVIAMLEGLHAKNVEEEKPNGAINNANWRTYGGATITDSGVATCDVTITDWCYIDTASEDYSRPMSVSWTSKRLGREDNCVLIDVFPQKGSRHSGYTMGYGFRAQYLGFGKNGIRRSRVDGDTSINHVYKMVLTNTSVEFWQDENMYGTIDDTTYQSGGIRIGQSCVKWEVSDVTVTQL